MGKDAPGLGSKDQLSVAVKPEHGSDAKCITRDQQFPVTTVEDRETVIADELIEALPSFCQIQPQDQFIISGIRHHGFS